MQCVFKQILNCSRFYFPMALTASLVVGGTAAVLSGVVGTGIAYRRRKRNQLRNKLFGTRIVDLEECFLDSEEMPIPFIVERCAFELERRNTKHDIFWNSTFIDAATVISEDDKELQKINTLFTDPRTRKRKNITFGNIITRQVLEILLNYLEMLPEPLFKFSLYPEFVKNEEEYKETGNFDNWRDNIVEFIFKVHDRNRKTAMRIIELCNKIYNSIPEPDNRSRFLYAASDKLVLSFLSTEEEYEEKVETEDDETANMQLPIVCSCLRNMIINYSDIVSASVFYSHVAE